MFYVELSVEQVEINATSMPFVKGQSGNPAGRPKMLAEVQEYARKRTKKNIDAMVKISEESEDDGIRLRALQILHEIAWGKPTQQVTGPEGGPIELSVKWITPAPA